jgi:hypothetical protein
MYRAHSIFGHVVFLSKSVCSVVIDDLDIEHVAILEPETNAPLRIVIPAKAGIQQKKQPAKRQLLGIDPLRGDF